MKNDLQVLTSDMMSQSHHFVNWSNLWNPQNYVNS